MTKYWGVRLREEAFTLSVFLQNILNFETVHVEKENLRHYFRCLCRVIFERERERTETNGKSKRESLLHRLLRNTYGNC